MSGDQHATNRIHGIRTLPAADFVIDRDEGEGLGHTSRGQRPCCQSDKPLVDRMTMAA